MGFFDFFFYSACVAIAIGNQLSFMFRSSMNYVDHKLSRKNVFVMSSFFGIMMSVAIYYFLFIFYYHNLGYHDKFLDMPVGLVLTMFCSGIFFVMKNIFSYHHRVH